MSQASNAAILSIGACANDGRPDFYVRVDLATSISSGLHVDASTIKWWMSQEDSARQSLFQETRTLRDSLLLFAHWLGETMHNPNAPENVYSTEVVCELWGYPAQFDLTILGGAYRALEMKIPWHYRAPRCLRTAAALFPSIERVQPKVAHDSLEDAKAQMQWLENILQYKNAP